MQALVLGLGTCVLFFNGKENTSVVGAFSLLWVSSWFQKKTSSDPLYTISTGSSTSQLLELFKSGICFATCGLKTGLAFCLPQCSLSVQQATVQLSTGPPWGSSFVSITSSSWPGSRSGYVSLSPVDPATAPSRDLRSAGREAAQLFQVVVYSMSLVYGD